MNDNDLLQIETKPGDMIQISRWDGDILKPFQDFSHEQNMGPLILPPGHYVYVVVSQIGEYKNL